MAAAAATLTIGAASCTTSGLSSRTLYGTSSGSCLRTTLTKSAGFPRRAGHGVVQCRMEQADEGDAKVSHGHVPRRLAIALIAGAAAVISKTSPAEAAYGEAANIFAPLKTQSGFKSYVGEGFKLDVPAKWNPSKEVEFPGQVMRYEDNFDVMSNLSVSILKAEKSSMNDYGSPQEFLKSISYVLGKQSYSGKTISEGGFEGNKVATAAILDTEVKESNGKIYYGVSVLTRTADGDEGGKHQLIVATIDGGKLFLLKAQAGDKRWFKGTKKFVEGVASSFNVV